MICFVNKKTRKNKLKDYLGKNYCASLFSNKTVRNSVFDFAFKKEYKKFEMPKKAKRHYKSGGQLFLQKGYMRRGKFVKPHLKTKPDGIKSNNRKNILGF